MNLPYPQIQKCSQDGQILEMAVEPEPLQRGQSASHRVSSNKTVPCLEGVAPFSTSGSPGRVPRLALFWKTSFHESETTAKPTSFSLNSSAVLTRAVRIFLVGHLQTQRRPLCKLTVQPLEQRDPDTQMSPGRTGLGYFVLVTGVLRFSRDCRKTEALGVFLVLFPYMCVLNVIKIK